MADIIVEVHNVLPATGWFFGKPYYQNAPLSEYEPVVVFAHVTVFDTDYPNSGHKRMVIPLNIYDYSDLSALAGNPITKEANEIFYVTQFIPPEGYD